jgi:hypothetical protein
MPARGVVVTHWKLVQSSARNDACGRSIMSPSCRIKPVLPPIHLKNRPFVYGSILCIVFSAGPVYQPAYSDPNASLRQLSELTATIVRPVASSVEFHVQNVTGPAGVPLPLAIDVSKSEEDTGGRLFIFTGIPNGVKLNPGGDLGMFWAVNSNAFDRLTLLAPEGFRGSFQIEVTQTDTVPEDSKRKSSFLVTITPPPEAQANTRNLNAVVPRGELENISPDTRPADLPILKDKNLMERAFSLFGKGDVSAARAIFQYLAARGNAEAAIAMGGTYDPLVLSQLYIKGMTPEPEQAQAWYEKAEVLGSTEARRRLNALAQR